MDKKEWTAYYVLLNGKKPSKKEMNIAFKNGEFIISKSDKIRARKKLYFLILFIALTLSLLLIASPMFIRSYHDLMAERYEKQYEKVVTLYQKGIDTKSEDVEYRDILKQPSRQPSYTQVDSNGDGKEELYIVFDDGTLEYHLIAAYEVKFGKIEQFDVSTTELNVRLRDAYLERFNVEKLLTINFKELSEQNYEKVEGDWITNNGTAHSLYFSEEGLLQFNVQTHNTVENDDYEPIELEFSEVENGQLVGNFNDEEVNFELTFVPKGIEHGKSDKNYDRIYYKNEEVYFYRSDEIIGTLEKRPIDMLTLTSGKYSGIANDYSSIAGKWASLSTPEGKYLRIDENGVAYLPWSTSNGMQISYLDSYSNYLVGYLEGQNSYSMTISIIPAGFKVDGADNNDISKDRIAIGEPLDRFNDPQVYYRVEE